MLNPKPQTLNPNKAHLKDRLAIHSSSPSVPVCPASCLPVVVLKRYTALPPAPVARRASSGLKASALAQLTCREAQYQGLGLG